MKLTPLPISCARKNREKNRFYLKFRLYSIDNQHISYPHLQISKCAHSISPPGEIEVRHPFIMVLELVKVFQVKYMPGFVPVVE